MAAHQTNLHMSAWWRCLHTHSPLWWDCPVWAVRGGTRWPATVPLGNPSGRAHRKCPKSNYVKWLSTLPSLPERQQEVSVSLRLFAQTAEGWGGVEDTPQQPHPACPVGPVGAGTLGRGHGTPGESWERAAPVAPPPSSLSWAFGAVTGHPDDHEGPAGVLGEKQQPQDTLQGPQRVPLFFPEAPDTAVSVTSWQLAHMVG